MEKENFEIPSWMESSPRKQPLEAPEGYFEFLENTLQLPAQETPVPVRRLWVRYTSYAAAAMVLLSVGIWGYSAYNSPALPVEAPLQAQLQTISRDEISKAIEQEGISEELIEEIAAEELDETSFLMAYQEPSPDPEAAPAKAKTDSMPQELISAGNTDQPSERTELENYLIENTDINDLMEVL